MVQQLAGAHPGWTAAGSGTRPAVGRRAWAVRGTRRRAAADAAKADALRVEHRYEGTVEEIGRLPAGTPRHHATLAPFASHLHLAGRASGEVALVEADTGAVLARRRLQP